jgi:hypothetical protein
MMGTFLTSAMKDMTYLRLVDASFHQNGRLVERASCTETMIVPCIRQFLYGEPAETEGTIFHDLDRGVGNNWLRGVRNVPVAACGGG